MIQVAEMLRQMERTDERHRPQPFSLRVCTCDEKRKTGGKMLELAHVVLGRLVQPTGPAHASHLRKTRPQPEAERPARRDTQSRTVFNPATQETLTVHIRLITQFNGQLVID